MIRVLIADDHELVRQGLSLMFGPSPDIEVVGTAASGEEALLRAAELEPDVILMDLRMPGMGGLAALRMLQQRGSMAKVLVLTGVDGPQEVMGAVQAGAAGYLVKQTSVAHLVDAIRAVAAGQSYLDPAVTGEILSLARRGFREVGGPWHLSQRELEVLGLAAQGLSNREIAGRLFLSDETIRTHIKNTLRKMGKKHRLEAVLAALQVGLLDSRQGSPDSPDFPLSGDGNRPPRGSQRARRPSHTGAQPLT
ncbi:MAG: response regulator [Candidatus Dormibacteria bacterium]